MAEKTKCRACSGWGYHVCECWPGDCICGFGDEPCEDCDGEGFIWRDDDWDDFAEPRATTPTEERPHGE